VGTSITISMVPRIALTLCALAVVTPILAIFILILRIFVPSGKAGFYFSRIWTAIMGICMGITHSVEGAEKVDPSTSYIVTPNHQGNADIVALYLALPVPFFWVVKRELTRIPFFGWALASIGSIALDRSNRSEAIELLREGCKKLSGGWSMVIYPEGTRSPDANLQPFKKGAFMMAVQTGIPILPVVCNGAFRILPRKTMALRPGRIHVVIGDPIPTEGLTEADVPALMERTREAMLKLLDGDYDPFAPAASTP
jgi:1-acyl-sn-glycerol-3-phosphate acyltransferase